MSKYSNQWLRISQRLMQKSLRPNLIKIDSNHKRLVMRMAMKVMQLWVRFQTKKMANQSHLSSMYRQELLRSTTLARLSQNSLKLERRSIQIQLIARKATRNIQSKKMATDAHNPLHLRTAAPHRDSHTPNRPTQVASNSCSTPSSSHRTRWK